ncbi:two-component system regulatory protein YycI [Anaerotignum lactatifermentans]|uniref:Two-component system regulatory protein YycI n=1 Tax=Anaerotignum lactatifermentans TaxID=160404 RepID=A0ABS2GD82_9FIRM|nr:two-component system regulatory protein YycI [Anaerotignum lactatifermentans]MBM6830103.1 two-component system regulatory protein YycI [Anaerotignum lactatifermentans]MBM6878665.1 two-component system regulatory protein YycI [Anaerotignum lactatifermentans]MBM6951730.1 two-component system regulatory protein YycI [Anaerotignum lactatifermentans]
MEWGRAKKFVIVLLLLLNVCLAGLNYQQERAGAMTASQERAIFEVLSRNGITMYTDLITETQPMSRLSVTVPSYTKERLEQIFFQGEKTIVVPGKTSMVYRSDSLELILEGLNGVLRFSDVEPGRGETNRGSAVQIAEKYMEGIEDAFPDFVSADVADTEDGFCVEFYQKYKSHFIFSNWFRVYVCAQGIYRVEFSYGQVTGEQGEKKDIFYADEALLTFMRTLKEETVKGEITVNRMELGYDLVEQTESVSGSTLNLVPCYRIDTMELDSPYIINAYTCQVVS